MRGGKEMDRFINVRSVLAVLAVLLVVTGVQAQTTTGRLIGTVFDDTGIALPGVTVTIASPALIGGAQTKITDGGGEFAFIGVAPGDYTVNVVLSGFVTQERSEVKVPLGGAASIIIEMPQGTFAGEIEVVADTPVVDPTQVNTGVVLDSTYLQGAAIGSANRSYQSVLFQAPGVSGGANPRVFGSSQRENAYYVDGVNTTDPVTATFGTNFNFDAIQEIQFQTGGFEAEYGMATGGVVNLVTKSGGNQFSGTVDIRYRDDNFNTSGDHFDANTQDTAFQDIGITFGGPIMRDKVWFFASYEYVNSEQTPTGSPNTRDFEGNYPLAKLTWQINPSWRLTGKYTSDPADISNWNAAFNIAEDAGAFQEQGSDVYSAELSAVLSNSLLWNTIIGVYRSDLNGFPQHGDLSLHAHNNAVTGEWYNSYSNQQYSNRDRDEIKTDLTWFVDDLAGSHEFKAGLGYQDLNFTSGNCNTGTPGGETCAEAGVSGIWYQELPGGQPFVMNEIISPGLAEDAGKVGSIYVQDAWRVMPNLTLKLGIRYDQATYDNDVGTEVADLNKVQPRVAAAWDITGNSKNVLRANWGQYMHPNSTTLPDFVNTNATTGGWWLSCSYFTGMDAEACQAFAAAMGFGWRTDPENQDPAGWLLTPANSFGAEPNQLDPNLKAVYVDQLILGYERAVGRRASIEFSYINKKTKDMFEDTCNGNWPGPPSADADCSYFIMANLPVVKRDYEGFTVKYENRTYSWLTLLTSYTYSKSKGSQEDRNASALFDVYPVDFENRYGWMGDQRLHRFKLNGFFSLKGDWTIGFDYFYSSDFRWQPTATNADPGYQDLPPGHTLFVESRGNREANPNHQLDLQLSKGFTIGNQLRLVLIGSVLNALDSEKGTVICQSVSGCGTDDDGNFINTGDATAWQQPMRFELGFRVEF